MSKIRKKCYLGLLSILLLTISSYANEVPLKIQKVTNNVYALVGELDQRSEENYGNNATFGVVITKKGVVLIDPGGSYLGAKQIDDAIHTITKKDVKIVINSGGQDHRWIGNSYFKEKGAKIIASKAAVADQKHRQKKQFISSHRLIKNNFKNAKPVYADEMFDKSMEFSFGSEKFLLVYAGPAHTKGDIFIWMPEQHIMFGGDIVYTDRLLGPGPASNTESWLKVFEQMVSYKPKWIIPGHGSVANVKKATNDTYDYIKYMRKQVSELIDNDGDMQDAKKIDQSKFSYLAVYEKFHKKAAQSFFMQMEFE